VNDVSTNEERKKGTPPLKRRYSTVIGSSNVKIVADRHIHAIYHNKQCDELLRNVYIDDLE